jgi:hypothetical protein
VVFTVRITATRAPDPDNVKLATFNASSSEPFGGGPSQRTVLMMQTI